MDFRMVSRLLGRLTLTFAAAICIPLVIALAMDRANAYGFACTLLFSVFIAIAFLSMPKGRPNQRLRIREAIAVVGSGWLLICALGALPYMFCGITDPITAMFESVSGFTTTGVTTANSFDEFPPSLLVWRCMTHWCGGIGVIMLFIIVMPQVNGNTGYMFNAELPGAVAERSLPRIRESAMLIVKIYTSLTVLAAVLFMLGGVPVYSAINAAIATMATGGFTYYHESLVAFSSVYTELVAIAFMLIASINFSFYYRIFNRQWEEVAKYNEYKYFFMILGGASVLITANLYCTGYASLWECFRHGVFHAVSIGSTTGFAADDFNNWPSFSRYVLMMLMFVGGCSGSTAGGIKISRVIILLKASWAELLRILHPRIVYTVRLSGKVIDSSRVGSITRFFFLYMFVFVVLTILISLTGTSIMDSMGMIAACLSSVGPAFGIVGPTFTYSQLSLYGRVIIILAMLLGRLEIFTLMVIMRPDFWSRKKNW